MSWTVAECCVEPEVPTICRLNVPRGVLPLVESVRAEFAPLLPAVTLDGENLQVVSPGSPEQENATAELTAPPNGATVTLNWTDLECLTVAAVGLTAMEKSTPVPLRLRVGVVVVMPSEPVTASVPGRVPIAVGVNMTLKVHWWPAWMPATQLLVCE